LDSARGPWIVPETVISGGPGRARGHPGCDQRLLVEFPSVVAAVECAMAVQELMAKRNVDVPDDRRMQFRIGVNLGDVLVEGDDILGDGVNVAARLEGAAEPGGIYISDAARRRHRRRWSPPTTVGWAASRRSSARRSGWLPAPHGSIPHCYRKFRYIPVT
jgi:hypothetical protein